MKKKRTEIGGYLEWNFNIFYTHMLISNADFVAFKEIFSSANPIFEQMVDFIVIF